MESPREVTTLEYLLLVRLLDSASQSSGQAKLSKDLETICSAVWPLGEFRDRLAAALEGLLGQGLIVTAKRKGLYALSESGRQRALAYLGVGQLPAKITWAQLKGRYLVGKALGLSLSSPREAKSLASADGLKGALLWRAHALPFSSPPTFRQAMDALLWRSLGAEKSERFSLNAVKSHLLHHEMGLPAVLEASAMEQLAAVKAAGARAGDLAALREALLSGMLSKEADGPTAAPPTSQEPAQAPPPGQLQDFATAALEAARACQSGRFGSDKVFISHVYVQIAGRWPMSLEEFKNKLIRADEAGLLKLSRADLVEAMDPTDVRDSEAIQGVSRYHFVRLD